MTQPTRVAIIGLGSRGLSVLERLITSAKLAGEGAGELVVTLVDPQADGAGVHALDQPDYLLLNTTAGQVSMFPDRATVGRQVDAPGPSLYEWGRERGLRLAPDGYTVGDAGRPIRPTDFLPRRVLGEYLNWFLGELRRRAPGWVRLATYPTEAVDLADRAGQQLAVALATGETIEVDYAVLTTGYTANQRSEQADRTIAEPYPLPEQLAQVRPGETVAIGGFGLSAMDLMSCLTVGRGGRYEYDGDQCTYLPSGDEPVLLFYSRSGVPCRARPKLVTFDKQYRPRVFTRGAIDALRLARGGPLDFRQDLLPLLLTELRIAYRRCEADLAGGADAEAALDRRLDHARGTAGIIGVLDRLDQQHGRFDPAGLFDGGVGMLRADSAAYQKWLAEVVKADLVEGLHGFTGSPVKAALDVLRSTRDLFRYAVDFGGLTAESIDDFFQRVVPMVNRAVVGPQYERHSELLALLGCGLAHAPFGPAPTVTWQPDSGGWLVSSTALDTPYARRVDWLCAGNTPLPAVAGSASRLLESLHRRGWVRPFRPENRNLPGIDVDPEHHPVRADGSPERRLWVLGPLCEGATFYNNLVPSPGAFSRPLYDAHRVVQAMRQQAAA